jgi:hypothetical protein
MLACVPSLSCQEYCLSVLDGARLPRSSSIHRSSRVHVIALLSLKFSPDWRTNPNRVGLDVLLLCSMLRRRACLLVCRRGY